MVSLIKDCKIACNSLEVISLAPPTNNPTHTVLIPHLVRREERVEKEVEEREGSVDNNNIFQYPNQEDSIFNNISYKKTRVYSHTLYHTHTCTCVHIKLYRNNGL